METSPKLEAAMVEIQAILDKNDLAGIVVLHTQKHIQFYNKINPGYSCARIEGRSMVFDLDVKHYDGDTDKQINTAFDTADMLNAISDNLAGLWFITQQGSHKLDEILGIKRPTTKPTIKPTL